MAKDIPDWFKLTNIATPETMKRISDAVVLNNMDLQIKNSPMLAHWFMLDSLLLANRANKDGMHANALALTRQCIEAISIIELGICGHSEANSILLKWEKDQMTPGKVRAWLEENVWDKYGSGLWNESWTIFMREFSKAIQPYAHYGRDLAQWQVRLHRVDGIKAVLEMKPHAYDPQKATRITLYHALLTYVLGRVWLSANHGDEQFEELICKLGIALGKSRYLDGHATNWSQQFWAMLWDRNDGIILE
ncbi:hypothetical protein FJU30_04920 [Affinibrenneria salicis]|uniref:Uncharacterized protein n=1 Tax=Affinibrenneria salicis TaxID=2590031 RepID=A0A5J5G3F5_9GAMM|nr:hypothetical protein [Affinibrenneria salicis]KAA9001637.1 hypothetical protein FJU30_04920 [Affinibrenneria salicis]